MRAAFLLAAGAGSRLRPLTDLLPKPMLPVANRPIIDRNLEALSLLGVERVVVNVSHLADMLVAHLGDGRRWGMELIISREPQLLGTGGGLAQAAHWLADDDHFLVMNADIVHSINLREVALAHKNRSAATLVMRVPESAITSDPIIVAPDGSVRGVPGWNAGAGPVPLRFTGVHVLTPAIFEYLYPGASMFEDGYAGLLSSGMRVEAHIIANPCIDAGTPSGYLGANWLAIDMDTGRSSNPVCLAPGVRIGDGVRLGSYVAIGRGCRIGERADIDHTVVLDEAAVAPGARLRNAVVYRDGVLTCPLPISSEGWAAN